MPVKRNVLIAGCGYVGSALAVRLMADGHRVTTLRRSAVLAAQGGHTVQADLVSGAGLDALPGDIDTVFYTAGADGFSEEAYRNAYVVGLRNLLNALTAKAAPVRHVFFTSSTGVYAQDNGEWVDEDSPTEPRRFSGTVLLEAEAELAHAAFPTTVVRFGGIYGPNRTRLIDTVRNGSACSIALRTQYLNLIHRDDCAGVLLHLLQLESPASCYVAVDDEPVERGALLAWLAGQLRVPVPPARPEGDAPEPQRGGDRRVRNARLRASGYTFLFPSYREGYGAILEGEIP